jgi:CPA1 family monovalent cation:H+ antiporter
MYWLKEVWENVRGSTFEFVRALWYNGSMISTFVILLAFLALAFSALARRLGFSPELFLVIMMGAISFLPFIPRFTVDGHVLLEIILPPLLFSAARNLSGYKFRKMRGPIIYLGFFMIFVTAIVVALLVSHLAGFMTFTTGLILGAVVAPPDAVSSVSIGKKLGLPERVMTILTGESLINDAAALTLFTFAVSIVYNQASFIDHPAVLFAWVCIVGVLFGLVTGAVTLLVRKLLQESNIIAVFTAIVPFAAYIGAETIHASGVLAVVTTGFMLERTTFRATYVTRLQEKALWRSIETLFDSFVFAYIGLQLRFIITDLIESKLDTLNTILIGFIVLAVVIVVRPIGVLGYNAVQVIWYKMQYKHLKHFVSRKKREQNLSDAPVSWREYIILSWTGMRGVVTLAAASAVPVLAVGQVVVSHQSVEFQTHIFIQVVGLIVAVGTLMIQGLTLPLLIKKVSKSNSDSKAHEPLEGQWGKARKLMEESALKVIEAEYEADPEHVDKERIESVWRSLDLTSLAKNKKDISFVSKLLVEIVETQREDIMLAARTGELHPDVAREFLDRIDYRLASYTPK